MKKFFKKYKYILFILLFSILIMVPSFGDKYYQGHDSRFHAANIDALTDQISLSNPFPSNPVGKIANDFGYGTRIFYPPLPHLLASYINLIIDTINIGDVFTSMRITQFITFFLSGITFYFLAKRIFKNDKIALLSSCFYMTAPYHLSQIFIRDSFSEMFIPIAIPMIILGLIHLIDKKKTFFPLFIGGYCLAIYSHLAMSIYFTIILLASFFIVYRKEIFTKKNILYLLISSLLILIITSPFLITMARHKLFADYAIFIPYHVTPKGDLYYNAINIFQLFDFTKPLNYDWIRFHLMLFQYILIILGIKYIKKAKEKKLWSFIILFTLISVIMVTHLFPWYFIPNILDALQFPWRLSIYIALGGSILACLFVSTLEKKSYFNKVIISLILLTICGSYLYTSKSTNIILDSNLEYSPGMGNQTEYLPTNTIKNIQYFNNRSQDIIILNGNSNITVNNNNVPNLEFTVTDLKQPITVELPRLYYLDYQLEKDGKIIQLTENNKGFLQATLIENGTYQLTYPNKIHNILQIVSLLTIIGSSILYFKYKEKK